MAAGMWIPGAFKDSQRSDRVEFGRRRAAAATDDLGRAVAVEMVEVMVSC